jgi:hypothetical protein
LWNQRGWNLKVGPRSWDWWKITELDLWFDTLEGIIFEVMIWLFLRRSLWMRDLSNLVAVWLGPNLLLV